MTAKDLERVLGMVPPNTPIRFEIGSMELHATSAVINHGPFDFTVERGELATMVERREAEDIVIGVAYGPEAVEVRKEAEKKHFKEFAYNRSKEI